MIYVGHDSQMVLSLFFAWVVLCNFTDAFTTTGCVNVRRNDCSPSTQFERRRQANRGVHTTSFTFTPPKASTIDVDGSLAQPDYLITDSVDLVIRPSLPQFLSQPRNLVGSSLVIAGGGLAAFNVVGNYNDGYVALQQISIFLAVLSSALDFQAVTRANGECKDRDSQQLSIDPRYRVSPNIRCGCSDDALVHMYAASYTTACAWLALRTSVACPSSLINWDVVFGPCAALVFSFSLAAPGLTLLHHYRIVDQSKLLRFMVRVIRQIPRVGADSDSDLPALSSTELFRAQSLLAIGIIGCIFAPEVLVLTLQGQDWWLRASHAYPGQQWIESTNALFGVYATQLSMIAHRAGKQGVATYLQIVPTFTFACLLLTVFPSGCSLYWWGDQISFFEFYSL
jgi:hypothetical protein